MPTLVCAITDQRGKLEEIRTQEGINTCYGYDDDGLNLYAYCANNPVVYYEPSGYAECENADTQQKAKDTAAGNVANEKVIYSDKQLITAANDIHHVQYGDAWWGKKNPVTVTQAVDGTVVVSKNNGVIGPKSRQKAVEVFCDGVIIVQGQGVNYNNAENFV